MKIGKILIVLGLVSFIPVALIIAQETGAFATQSPPVPVGIGGWVKFANGSFAPDTTIVTAKNLMTGEIASRNVQNGYFAIPLPARDNDEIQVTATLNGYMAQKIITVDMSVATQWCNLTFGHVETKTISWWLLIVPFSLVGMGYYIDRKS